LLGASSALRLALTLPLFFGFSSAFAGTVGGSVTAINTLVQNDISNIPIGSTTPGADNSQTDTTIVTGTIDNNNEAGWKLTVVSTNSGKLLRGTGGAGREILYTNVKFVQTAGTLGAGLNSVNGVTRNIVTGANAGGTPGTTVFNTGASFGIVGTATTATEALTYDLQISWSNDTTLIAGNYTDTITLTLENDI
jgi:hypothetical protein